MRLPRYSADVLGWAFVFVGPAALTAVLVHVGSNQRDYVFLYLGEVAVLGVLRGLWPALAAATLSLLQVDYFFVPPVYTERQASEGRWLGPPGGLLRPGHRRGSPGAQVGRSLESPRALVPNRRSRTDEQAVRRQSAGMMHTLAGERGSRLPPMAPNTGIGAFQGPDAAIVPLVVFAQRLSEAKRSIPAPIRIRRLAGGGTRTIRRQGTHARRC
jgi:hypothetical protein